VSNDPVRKAGLIRDVVETIAKIPDPIIRSVYIKQCATLMEMEEQVLISEMNKTRRQVLKKEMPGGDVDELLPEILIQHSQHPEILTSELQERNVVRLLLNFGSHDIHFDAEVDDPALEGGKTHQLHAMKVCNYIVTEIAHDDIFFENQTLNNILKIYTIAVEKGEIINTQQFFVSPDPSISEIAVELLTSKYFLSENWQVMHNIIVPEEETILMDAVEKAVFYLKNIKVLKMLEDSQKKIKEAHEKGEDFMPLMERHKQLEQVKMEISRALGIDILR
jgi:DNA primase